MRIPKSILCLFLLAPLTACGDDGGTATKKARSGPPVVQCVNYPLAYFAERLAGEAVEVRFDAPAGEDPAFWKPTDDQIGAFQSADLILRNGAGYAKWMKTVSLPAGRMLDTTEGFEDKLITTTGGVTHAHGPGGDHDHGNVAYTTWLDFNQATGQAVAIAIQFDLKGYVADETLEANKLSLGMDLGALHKAMRTWRRNWRSRPLLASHAVYQYLARAYDLNLKSEHFEPDKVPSDDELEILGSMLRNFKATVMLWEAQPLPETVKKLEALGVRSVVFDPCANRPASGDFLSVMQGNVERLTKALSE